MIILGLAATHGGEAAAALLSDQTLIAASDEATLSRLRIPGEPMPWAAARFCLQQAGIRPQQVDTVAVACAPFNLSDPTRWHYAARLWQAAPLHALKALATEAYQHQYSRTQLKWLCDQLGIESCRTPLISVERTLALASAGIAYAAPAASTCVLSCNDTTAPTAALFGRTDNGRFQGLSRLAQPDSLLHLMQAMGIYLGFDETHALEGIALLARHGDATRYDLSNLFSLSNGNLRINLQYFDPTRQRGWQHQGKRYPFTAKLVDRLGPPAIEASATEAPAIDPHAHYAAALQHMYEQTISHLLTQHLGESLTQSSALLLCGAAGSNRYLNTRLMQAGLARQLQVSPYSGSIGAAIGAATWVASQHGILMDKLDHPFWGPGYLQEECIAACKKHPSQPVFEIIKDRAKKAARLLAEGHAVGWFQGRAEASTLPLGARALLYNPTSPQRPHSGAINKKGWSEIYLPVLSVAATQAHRYTADTLEPTFASRYVELLPDASQWLPQDLQRKNTAPLQIVAKKQTPRFHSLLEEMEKMTGHGIVLQLPLQAKGEPRVCSPTDALDWLASSPVNYMVMEDLLIKKTL